MSHILGQAIVFYISWLFQVYNVTSIEISNQKCFGEAKHQIDREADFNCYSLPLNSRFGLTILHHLQLLQLTLVLNSDGLAINEIKVDTFNFITLKGAVMLADGLRD